MASRILFPPLAPHAMTIPDTGFPNLKSSKISWSSRSSKKIVAPWPSSSISPTLSHHILTTGYTCQTLWGPCSAPVCLPPCPLQFLLLPLLAPSHVPPTECPRLPLSPTQSSGVQGQTQGLWLCSSSRTVSSLRAGLCLFIFANGIRDRVENPDRSCTDLLMQVSTEWSIR